MTRALVLSGGGPVGIGWESGIAAGLKAQGIDLADADDIVGTSAGSVVGAQLAGGRDMSEVVRMRASRPSSRPPETTGANAEQMQALMQAFGELFTSTEPDEVKRAKIGKFALEATTPPEEAFLANFGHLVGAAWPDRYRCTAVDAVSGEFVVWDGTNGEDLGAAVASSCAVPGIFPPITINGRRYVDGGMRSGTNGDLAAGHDRVLFVSLMDPSTMAGPMAALAATYANEVKAIEDAGGSVHAIFPDADARSAMGVNLMDPSLVQPASEAGERQGKAVAEELRSFWV